MSNPKQPLFLRRLEEKNSLVASPWRYKYRFRAEWLCLRRVPSRFFFLSKTRSTCLLFLSIARMEVFIRKRHRAWKRTSGESGEAGSEGWRLTSETRNSEDVESKENNRKEGRRWLPRAPRWSPRSPRLRSCSASARRWPRPAIAIDRTSPACGVRLSLFTATAGLRVEIRHGFVPCSDWTYRPSGV